MNISNDISHTVKQVVLSSVSAGACITTIARGLSIIDDVLMVIGIPAPDDPDNPGGIPVVSLGTGKYFRMAPKAKVTKLECTLYIKGVFPK